MRILFIVPSEPGHLNPCIGVAQELERLGHTLTFATSLDASARLAAAGLAARCRPLRASGPAPAMGREAFTELLRDPAGARSFYRLYAGAALATLDRDLATLHEIVAGERPDVIVSDGHMYAAPLLAAQLDVPWAQVANNLTTLAPRDWSCPYLDYLTRPAEQRRAAYRARGLELESRAIDTVTSPWLTTVFTTPELAPREAAGNDDVIYVGPATTSGRRGDEPEFPWDRVRDDRPLVYASFGTQLSPGRAVLEALASALPAEEAQLVLVVDEEMVPPPTLPAHVIAVPYAPQLALLERAAVMVSHGGMGGVSECLSRGKPLCVVPLGHEQPLQAELVVRSGAGLRLTVDEAREPGRFAATLRELLGSSRYRLRAEEIGAAYRRMGGARRVAELVVELGATRRPIRP